VEALKRYHIPTEIAKYLAKRISDFKREYNGKQELYAVKGLIGMDTQRTNINQPARLLTFQPVLQYSRQLEEQMGAQTDRYYSRVEDPDWEEEVDFFEEY
jgi:hypothetical protein